MRNNLSERLQVNVNKTKEPILDVRLVVNGATRYAQQTIYRLYFEACGTSP